MSEQPVPCPVCQVAEGFTPGCICVLLEDIGTRTWNEVCAVILAARRKDFEAGRERIKHPDWDHVHDTFDDHLAGTK